MPLKSISLQKHSLLVSGLLGLEVRGNGFDNLLGLNLIVDLVGVEISGRSELELCDIVFLVLLDNDLLSNGQFLVLSSHDLDEFLELLDFLGLQTG